ncbi:MAG: histidinol-phosphate transaminase [Candidatus Aminicenantes bacterium]|nr:histidinol-phosphate transaminase [Candidatus Aminicenantes bacterium]
MIQSRDFLKAISPYKPGRPIEEVARELKLKGEIIKLASNENPLGTSPLALQAIRKALKESYLYPDDNCYYFRKKLAERWSVEPGNIVVGNGSVEILPLATLAYLDPEHSALGSEGAFIWFKIAARIAAAELIEVPMRNHTHDLQAMLKAVKPNTRMIYIANPNNPTGTIVDRAEVEDFFRRVPDDILVIMDEAYIEYITDPRFPDSFKYLRDGKNILILRTFSKIYGLAGARLGYGIAPKEIIASLAKLRVSFNVNRLSQVAGLAALDDDRHVRRGRAVNEAGKDYLYEAYRKMGLFYLPTFANFIFVDFARDSQIVFEALQKKGIITRTIKEYGFPQALRITIGTEDQNRKLIRALKSVL